MEALGVGVDGGQAVNLVQFYDDRVVHSVVPVPEAAELVGYPLELAAQIEALEPADRLELISSKTSSAWAHEAP